MKWAGLICLIISVGLVAFTGAKYQIKHGMLRSVGIKFNNQDKKIIRAAAILFVSGIVLFILAAL